MRLLAGFLLCLLWFHAAALAQQPATAPSAAASAEPGSGTKALGDLPSAELMKRVDANDPAAQNELALRYRYGGPGVDKDRDKAIEWFRKAAQNGSAKACFNLGVVYYNGDGVPANPDTACKWFLIASKAGDPSGIEAFERSLRESTAVSAAMCETAAGDTYLLGKEYPQDYARALSSYQEAARQKYGPAEERLAQIYDRGLGVSIDKQVSFEHLQRAAGLGQPSSAYWVGRAYLTGSVGTKDPKLALKWLEKSAMMQFPPAMMSLAAIYKTGDGVKQDQKKALMWYLLAVHFGLADAQASVQALSTELTAKQVHDAKSDAGDYVRHMGGGLVIKQP